MESAKERGRRAQGSPGPVSKLAFVFDLDGTLIDSVYQHVLALLTRARVPWAIATSGRRRSANQSVQILGLGPETIFVTRDDVEHAKPDPDLFIASAGRLGVPIGPCVVVGDSVWDLLAARRAGALGVGVLSGGYGEEELVRAGAYRVYADPAELLAHLDELGVRDAN